GGIWIFSQFFQVVLEWVIGEEHFRREGQVHVGPAADAMEEAVFADARRGLEADLLVHPPKTAIAGHEFLNNAPGQRRGVLERFGKVVDDKGTAILGEKFAEIGAR